MGKKVGIPRGALSSDSSVEGRFTKFASHAFSSSGNAEITSLTKAPSPDSERGISNRSVVHSGKKPEESRSRSASAFQTSVPNINRQRQGMGHLIADEGATSPRRVPTHRWANRPEARPVASPRPLSHTDSRDRHQGRIPCVGVTAATVGRA